MKKVVLVVAGGSGTRMGTSQPKQFLLLKGKPVLMHSIEKFHGYDPSIEIIVVLPADQQNLWKELCAEHRFNLSHTVVKGGTTRFESVKNGLSKVNRTCLVAIHDGVRPLVSTDTIERCFKTAQEKGNAIPVIDLKDSIREITAQGSVQSDRTKFKQVQTPQCFLSDMILDAFQQEYEPRFTDDASVAEAFGVIINLVQGNTENIKITHPSDLKIAESLL